MPRAFSSVFNEYCNSPEFAKAILWLMTIEHEDGIKRYVRGWEDVESNERVFEKSAFNINLPAEGEDTPPVIQLQFDAVDNEIATILRSNNIPPIVYLELALASSPDVIEVGPMEFEVRKYSKAGTTFSVELGYEPTLNTKIPCDVFNPSLFPSLF